MQFTTKSVQARLHIRNMGQSCFCDWNEIHQTITMIVSYMMTSSSRNIFRVTGQLYEEFTGYRWIPLTKASDVELWLFFICAWINDWVNKREAGDLRRHWVHYDVTEMKQCRFIMYSFAIDVFVGNWNTYLQLKIASTQIHWCHMSLMAP